MSLSAAMPTSIRSLFNAIINMCVEPGKMCMSEMSAIDAKGGLGMAGVRNLLPLTYDKYARRGAVFGDDPSYVASLCTVEEASGRHAETPYVACHRYVAAQGCGAAVVRHSRRCDRRRRSR